ncbi:epithelial cell adhesion molecule [Sceloporus undulatus]|uniref:epithelial cell adhesion molecule n=1 Tax=Sceloporus undulatus TaxID=8520 RepID=UPI001C4D2843|nr:epithelial cell adhesion molecule [Sceloporus undulatus]
MESPRGAALLLATLFSVLLATALGQEGCRCQNNRRTVECVQVGSTCRCKSYGSNVTVDCATLTSKCLLMKAEVQGTKTGRRSKPQTAYVDNDGIYNPDCDSKGNFKAKQCNGTTTCWCVNSAGVRRTEKSDSDITCNEVVRTSWIIMEMKHDDRNSPLDQATLERNIGDSLYQRYKLDPKHISVMYENPYITIELRQNASAKSFADVDIADVAYYFEKDVKEDPVIQDSTLNVMVAGEPLKFRDAVIYYVDEKPPEFSMKRLTPGVIAVIVVVVLAIVAAILVLVFTRRKRGKYEKAEIKELNEIPRERNS